MIDAAVQVPWRAIYGTARQVSAGNAKRRGNPGYYVGIHARDERCRAVTVTARLAGPVVLDPVWPLPLDGLLATVVRRDLLGENYGHVIDHHGVDIPLARCVGLARNRKQWHWLATCAIPEPDAGVDVQRYASRLTDHTVAKAVDAPPKNLSRGAGRYRDRWAPAVGTVTGTLTWRAAGHPESIRSILAGLHYLGDRHSTGQGRVVAWDVTDEGDFEYGAAWWAGCHIEQGGPARPIPIREADLFCDRVPVPAHAPTKPPYFKRTAQHICEVIPRDATMTAPTLEGGGPWVQRAREVTPTSDG